MAAKLVLVLCALAGGAMSQYLGGACGCGAGGLAYEGLAGPYALGGPYGLGCGVASTGGGLPVTSASPIAPVGVSVVSENAYEGPLSVGGNLPFLGTVALEGVLPTAGAGAVSYGCGNGAVGIAAEEGPVATGIAGHAPAAFGPGLAGIPYGGGFAGYPYGLNGIGCGCGAIY